MQLTKAQRGRFKIGKARNGRGIFARREFAQGATLFQVRGKRIACDEGDDTPEKARANAFRLDADSFVTPAGRLGDYLNHSCEPSARVVKRGGALSVVAVRAIRAGEEVAIDYATITAADDLYEMRCNCGAARCRKVVACYTRLPRALRARYLAQGLIPAYIRRIKA